MSAGGSSFFITGGTLRHDAPSYVERQADRELLKGLLKGEFCYVLTSRQMGKSSLMVRTAIKLREQGVHVIALDLTAVGQNLTPAQWYDGLLVRMASQLRLEQELEEFWLAHERLGPCQRFFAAIRDVVLPKRPGALVVFVDEIDSVRSLPFSIDEFFAAIRECYNRRAEEAEFNRLTFCLLGVATPSDLIRDTRTTPFNIGRRIELHDFTRVEAAPLAQGLRDTVTPDDGHSSASVGGDAAAVILTAGRLLTRILYWTGGHPYLTQRFCRAVAEDTSVVDAAGVDRICEELFLSSRAQERDDNLLFVRERLLRSETDLTSLLELYQKVSGGKQVPDDETSRLVNVLRLSGIVASDTGFLRVRNRIYSRVFDPDWVRAHLPDADVRRQRAAFQRGVLRTTAIAAVVVVAMTFMLVYAARQTRKTRLALAQSSFSQAKALRVSGLAGQRHASLQALREASRYHTNRTALRDEAIACLALMDLKEATNGPCPLKHSNAAALSPDLEISAAADTNGGISLRRLRDNQVLRKLPGFGAPAAFLRFGPTEPVLVAEYSGPSGNHLVVWDWQKGEKLFAAAQGACGHALDFSADGRKLALGRTDGKIVVHALPGGEVLHEIPSKLDSGSPRAPQAVRFHPSGDLLGVCSLDDQYVEIWNLARTQRVARPYHRGVVHDLSWHPRGQWLAAACADFMVYLWQTNDFDTPRRLAGHEGRVTAIAYNHRGTLLASLGNDETVRLWVPATERQMQRRITGHDFEGLRFSANDQLLVATARAQTNALVWEALGDEYVVLQVQTDRSDKLRTIDFSPDSRCLLAASGKQTTLWQADSGRELSAIQFTNAQAVRFAADSRHVIASGDTGLFECALDFYESRDRLRVEIGAVRQMESVLDLDGLGTMDLSLARTTAAVIRRENVLLLPLAPNPVLGLQTIHLGTYYPRAALHPAGTWLATGWAGTNELHLWNLSEATETPVPSVIPFAEHFAFSPDGQWLATSSGGEFQFYRVGAWTNPAFFIPRKILSDQHAPAAFSRDGRIVAVASSRYTIQLFQLPTNDLSHPELIATLESPDHLPLEMLAFSPDGRRLAAATDRPIVQLWNLALLRKGLAQLQMEQGWPAHQ